MENPFLKRVTEFLRDDEAFLAIVSPEPARLFLRRPAKLDALYDRLVFIRGTPGSGKTTLARLFEYPTLAALLRNRNIDTHKLLVSTLIECKAITRDTLEILGYRLAMENDYRNFWEFPYAEELKLSLMYKLIQARAVLGWISNLTSSGVKLDDITLIPRLNAQAATQTIGGVNGRGLLQKARAVELALYRIVGALVAPNKSHLDDEATSAYHPLDIIDRFEVVVAGSGGGRTLNLRPLLILDDAHLLHPVQFDGLQRWLMRRELSVARWILTRLDVMHPHEALAHITEDRTQTFELPGVTASRETEEILLQSSVEDRREQRISFRKMAKDMANRYLRKMPLFVDRDLLKLSDLLSTDQEPLAPSKQKELESNVAAAQKSLSISQVRCKALEELVDTYRPANRALTFDVRLAMLNVVMHRYANRIPQRGLFEDSNPEPSKPLSVDAQLYEAARIHLLHQFGKPYYLGIDDLCDASSENAEQFLHLAAILVEDVSTRLIRSRQASLDPATQTKLLRQKAEEAIAGWNFPRYDLVRRVVTTIAERCLAVTLAPNAPLGPGANAYGIAQSEFDKIPTNYPDLARVLQFAVAYNAFTVVPRYECKNQKWCLLELGGLVILKHGLTLRRGGFIEGTAGELNDLIRENQ